MKAIREGRREDAGSDPDNGVLVFGVDYVMEMHNVTHEDTGHMDVCQLVMWKNDSVSRYRHSGLLERKLAQQAAAGDADALMAILMCPDDRWLQKAVKWVVKER